MLQVLQYVYLIMIIRVIVVIDSDNQYYNWTFGGTLFASVSTDETL